MMTIQDRTRQSYRLENSNPEIRILKTVQERVKIVSRVSRIKKKTHVIK